MTALSTAGGEGGKSGPDTRPQADRSSHREVPSSVGSGHDGGDSVYLSTEPRHRDLRPRLTMSLSAGPCLACRRLSGVTWK